MVMTIRARTAVEAQKKALDGATKERDEVAATLAKLREDLADQTSLLEKVTKEREEASAAAKEVTGKLETQKVSKDKAVKELDEAKAELVKVQASLQTQDSDHLKGNINTRFHLSKVSEKEEVQKELEQLKTKLEESSSIKEDRADKLKEFRQELDEIKAKHSANEDIIKKADDEINQMQSELKLAKEQLELTQKAQTARTQEKEQLSEQLEKINGEEKVSASSNSTLLADITKLKQELEETKKEISTQSPETDQNEIELHQLQQELQDKQSELQQMKLSLAEQQREIQTLQEEVFSVTNQQAGLKASAQSLVAELSSRRADKDALNKALTEAEPQQKQMDSELETLKQELQKLREVWAGAQKSYEAKNSERWKLQQDISTLQARVDGLEEGHGSINTEIEGLAIEKKKDSVKRQREIEERKQELGSSIVGLRDLKRSLEKTLSDALDNIDATPAVIKKSEKIRRAIEELEVQAAQDITDDGEDSQHVEKENWQRARTANPRGDIGIWTPVYGANPHSKKIFSSKPRKPDNLSTPGFKDRDGKKNKHIKHGKGADLALEIEEEEMESPKEKPSKNKASKKDKSGKEPDSQKLVTNVPVRPARSVSPTEEEISKLPIVGFVGDCLSSMSSILLELQPPVDESEPEEISKIADPLIKSCTQMPLRVFDGQSDGPELKTSWITDLPDPQLPDRSVRMLAGAFVTSKGNLSDRRHTTCLLKLQDL